MGKKLLIGCGVVLLLGVLGTGTCSYLVYSKGKQMFGDFASHTVAASQMPLERMQQEAVSVAPEELVEKLMDHAGRPVRLEGTVTSLDRASGTAPPPNLDQGNAVVIEPGILVSAVSLLPPGARTPGARLSVLGIATFINVGQERNGRPFIIVVAREVEVLKDPTQEAPPNTNAAPAPAEAAPPKKAP